MIVRLRVKRTSRQPSRVRPIPLVPAPTGEAVTWQELARGLATLLSPAAALCFALSVWRLGQDMGFARSFFITEGALSHWQMWLGVASVLLGTGQWLNRRARRDDDEPATN